MIKGAPQTYGSMTGSGYKKSSTQSSQAAPVGKGTGIDTSVTLGSRMSDSFSSGVFTQKPSSRSIIRDTEGKVVA